MTKSTILAQGAEAIIIREGDSIIKNRVSKGYRHPTLDKKIIKQRTKSEAKLLNKADQLIPSPAPLNLKEIELSKIPNRITMPFIAGKKLSENLEQLDYKGICKIIGNQIAKLHDNNIIHGDLTTSNMIWVENPEVQEANTKTFSNLAKQCRTASKKGLSDPRLYFIDFGLGFISPRIEDRAVDLHLIKQALEAKHFSIHKECEKIILENYNSKDKTKVLEQLKKVEARGRYKNAH